MGDLESDLLVEVETQLAQWRTEYAGNPDGEREMLWLLALEREQIVAVAYREEADRRGRRAGPDRALRRRARPTR